MIRNRLLLREKIESRSRCAKLWLQMWIGLLEGWREIGQAEPDDFIEACQQLKDAQLEHWASQAGGHGLQALAKALRVEDFQASNR